VEERVISELRKLFEDYPLRKKVWAGELTVALNIAISNNKAKISPLKEWPLELASVANKIPVQPSSLSVPWKVYQAQILDAQYIHDHAEREIEAILATVPHDYEVREPLLQSCLAPFEGSLVAYLANLIQSCREELLIVNPYWSVEGVETLSRRINFEKVDIEKIVFIAPANMDRLDMEGFTSFVRLFSNITSNVSIWTPKENELGFIPAVHAKVIISDSNKAYIGSANLSANGLSKSIELGVGLKGNVVKNIKDWFDGIKLNMRRYKQEELSLFFRN